MEKKRSEGNVREGYYHPHWRYDKLAALKKVFSYTNLAPVLGQQIKTKFRHPMT